MKKLASANLFVTSKRKSEKSPHQWANLTVDQDITIKAGSTISVGIWNKERQYKDPKGELLMLQEQDKNGHPIRSISLSVK